MFKRFAVIAVAATALISVEARAQAPEHVLLVVNTSSAASEQIADYYARARAIPQDNILRLTIDAGDEIPRARYERQIEGPIGSWFNRHTAHDRILYIVLTKGVPIRIAGTTGRIGTVASVDSELTLLYRKLTGRSIPPQGRVANPYFQGERPIAEAKPFTHESFDLFLVTRLDGFSVADVIGLIDRGVSPARSGRVVLDKKVSLLPDPGNGWLERSATLLSGMGLGDRVLLDATSRVVDNESDLLGYYSWGSNDPAFTTRHVKLGFVPGALAATFVSTDARTFTEPPAEWQTGRWENAASYFAGSPQSLIGDLIRAGATGVAGQVAEPYLDATVRPDVLFPAYLAGFNLVESFYLAMPFVSWQTVVVGDPLCAPFRTRTLTAQEIDRGTDPATELPSFFAARALQLAPAAAARDAAKMFVRAQARLGRGDRDGAREAFEQATALDARFGEAHLALADLYEKAGLADKAIASYRQVIAFTPSNVFALNNLAYALAVSGKTDALPEALSFAQRAYTLSRGNPSVADTLAWVLHLSGNTAEARKLITAAARGAPNEARIHLHAAVIDAAAGAFDSAARELARALEIDAALDKLPEVQELRAKLARAGKP